MEGIYILTQLWDQPLQSNYSARILEAHRAVEERQQRCPSPAHIRSLEFGPRPRQSAGFWSKHCALYSTPGQKHNNLYKIYGLNNEWEKHFEVIGCAQVPISPPGELVCTKQHKLNNWCTMQRRTRIALIWNMLRVAVLCRWWQSLFRKTKTVLIERERERELASFITDVLSQICNDLTTDSWRSLLYNNNNHEKCTLHYLLLKLGLFDGFLFTD